jgi:hypothetical protein
MEGRRQRSVNNSFLRVMKKQQNKGKLDRQGRSGKEGRPGKEGLGSEELVKCLKRKKFV